MHGNTHASRPTTDRLQGLLRTTLIYVTFCCVHPILLRPTRFLIRTVAAMADFFDSLKIFPGIHGNHGLSRLSIPSPHVVSRPSSFDHGGLKRDYCGRREHNVNVA